MNNKILFLFIIVCFISTNQSLSQTLEIKGGIGIHNVYDNDILTGRPREVKFNPSPFVSFLLDWKVSENIYLGWENRLRIKSDEIINYGLDTTTNTITKRSKSDVFLTNLDLKFISSFNLITEKKFSLIPHLSLGFSINLFEKDPRDFWALLNDNAILIYPDGEMAAENNNIFAYSGFIGELGIKALYSNLTLGFSTTIEFYETFLYNVGKPSYLYTTFFVGYRF